MRLVDLSNLHKNGNMLPHQDLFNSAQAIAYLRLDACSESSESAKRLLHRFATEGRLKPIRWAKTYLWSKPDLDAFVARELGSLQQDHPPAS